jgi:hypothetical protein
VCVNVDVCTRAVVILGYRRRVMNSEKSSSDLERFQNWKKENQDFGIENPLYVQHRVGTLTHFIAKVPTTPHILLNTKNLFRMVKQSRCGYLCKPIRNSAHLVRSSTKITRSSGRASRLGPIKICRPSQGPTTQSTFRSTRDWPGKC